MKKCTRCGAAKAPRDFHRNASEKDGLQRHCKDCARENQRQLAAKNQARAPVATGSKICSMCGKTKPRASFGIDRARKDGRSYYCRDCFAPRKKARNKRRRDQRQAELREDPAATKQCKQCGLVLPVAAFTPNLWNPDGREHRCRDCRRPQIRKHRAEWRRRNPERWSLQNRENARRRKAARDAPRVDLAAVLERHGTVCHICGDLIVQPRGKNPESLTFDHVIPLAKGGAHSEENLRPAHYVCNSRKGVKLMSAAAPG